MLRLGDLEDGDIPGKLKNGNPGDGHGITPQQCQGTEGKPEGLAQRCCCCAMARWEGVTSVSSRV